MPRRKTIFVPGEYYHIFNRSITHQSIFSHKLDLDRALEIIEYYLYQKPPLRFSLYNRLDQSQKTALISSLRNKRLILVELMSFCLMPNHYHLLIREKIPNGSIEYISKLQNSFVKYFNTRYKRRGPLFESAFRAVRIESEEQLLHVSRYIHLNPLTSYILKNEEELRLSPYSSYADYSGQQPRSFINTDEVLSRFVSPDAYRQFTINQVDYQRQLNTIKHLLLEHTPGV